MLIKTLTCEGPTLFQAHIYQLHGSAGLPQLPGPHSYLVSVDLVTVLLVMSDLTILIHGSTVNGVDYVCLLEAAYNQLTTAMNRAIPVAIAVYRRVIMDHNFMFSCS